MTLASGADGLKFFPVTASFSCDMGPYVDELTVAAVGSLLSLSVVACGAPPLAASTTPPPASVSSPSFATSIEAVELSVDEVMIVDGLRRHVQAVAFEIGERNGGKAWELAETADYVATQLEGLGYHIERQGYEVGAASAQNLTVTIRGGSRGYQVFYVGTHYDSPPSMRGVDTALTTAALLELARLMKGARLERTLKLVFFATGTSSTGDDQGRGAWHFARRAALEATKPADEGLPEAVRKASEVENFGALTLQALRPLRSPEAAQPDMLEVPLSLDTAAWKFESLLSKVMSDEAMRTSSIPLHTSKSDSLAMSEAGIPTVQLGIGPRGEAPASGILTEEELEAAGRVVMKIRQALGDILVERATNDAMVTPGLP